MRADLTPIHPDLHAIWRRFPRLTFSRGSVRALHWLNRLQPIAKAPEDILIDQAYIHSRDGKDHIRLRVYKSKRITVPAPALIWIHGGGYIIGTPEQDDLYMFELAGRLGIVVISVDYRLAPQCPFPAPLDDCYAALEWVHAYPQSLGIDPDRIAVGGASAGGGLAATLAQLVHDRGEIQPVFQLLVAPMLDDRTALRTNLAHADLLTWNQKSNRFGWESYLQQPVGSEEPAPYSVAARREDLTGLPPAWIGVGTLDLFNNEDVAYAQKLRACGVACELVIVPGAFHGFDVFSDDLPVIRDFRESQMAALRNAFSW